MSVSYTPKSRFLTQRSVEADAYAHIRRGRAIQSLVALVQPNTTDFREHFVWIGPDGERVGNERIGSGDRKSPTVTRPYPSREMDELKHARAPYAAHTHPYNRDRTFDPPSVADVAIYVTFYAAYHIHDATRSRLAHFVVTYAGIYELTIPDASQCSLLAVATRVCPRTTRLGACDERMHKTLYDKVCRTIGAKLMDTFPSLTAIDRVTHVLQTSWMQNKKQHDKYVEILNQFGICVTFYPRGTDPRTV